MLSVMTAQAASTRTLSDTDFAAAIDDRYFGDPKRLHRQGRARREYESAYLRRTYRDGGKVRHETLANLSGLPEQTPSP